MANNRNTREGREEEQDVQDVQDVQDILAGLWTSDHANMTLNYSRLVNGNTHRPTKRRRVHTAECELLITPDGYEQTLKDEFINLCKTGTSSQIEMFLLTHPRFDAHFNGEQAFVVACMNNTRDTVEYLYNRIGPNVSARNDEAFRFTCLANKILNAQFLMGICDRYNMTLRTRTLDDTVTVPDNEEYREYVIDPTSIQTNNDVKPKPGPTKELYNEFDELDEFEIDSDSDSECSSDSE
jgi:hypothetical protein